MKVYCMKVDQLKTKENKVFYKAFCYSGYGFTFDLFVDKKYYDYLFDLISEVGFVDISNDIDLRYDRKLDKLVYYLKNNIN